MAHYRKVCTYCNLSFIDVAYARHVVFCEKRKEIARQSDEKLLEQWHAEQRLPRLAEQKS